ncbi:outer membrane beta-barrel protein [Limnohabitans lacus]|jgi:Outer membrane protein beta-barrel domain|uniref:Outer membrane beta-barrel protein n=1 Tax=Limnohabitans lacus TaxID=3045173 RepID=A0ABT6XAQ7_9BURK|nr:outer membrane beta-barrel protein [Limnohabitans sp. HM2-2]MDI9235222.1 outer membrane beta-barrel protein [Limnohabitans sp. HM2-2]
MNIKSTCLAILALSASLAQAQWYGEIGVTPLSVKATAQGNTLKSHPTMADVVVGYEWHPNMAIEGILATNIESDTINLNGSEVPDTNLKVKSAYGFFFKPKVMLTPEWELFGRLGVIKNRTTGQVGSLSVTDTDHDFTYGIGVNYFFNKTTYGSLGYTSFYDKQNNTTRGATLALGMKF